MVDTLAALGIGALFVIGGDGTLRGAPARSSPRSSGAGLPIAVIGIPKTIDNDIHFIDRSFGFESAFAAAVEAIRSAHVEATGARNGIGLVKLMGRHSGFIACHAALASTDANFVLIPEVPLRLDGEARLPAQPGAPAGRARARRHRRAPRAPARSCASRRRAADGAAGRPTPAATSASRTSASCCAIASPGTSASAASS